MRSALRSMPALRNRSFWLIALAVSLFSVGVYLTTLGNMLLAEDILQAHTAREQLPHRLFPRNQQGYRPLMFVFWLAGDLLWGYQPVLYRAAALLLHTINGCLAAALARRLGAGLAASLFVGISFVALPSSAEVVNWVSAASNFGLGTVGYLLGLWAYLDRRPKAWRPRLVAGLGLLIALASNEIALLWPFAALTLGVGLHLRAASDPADRWPGRLSRALRAELAWIWPLLVVWALFLVWRSIAVSGVGGYGAETHLRAGLFLLRDLWVYIGFLSEPLGRSAAYQEWLHQVAAAPLLGLAGLAALVGLLWPARSALVATFWMLLPALNIPALHRGYLAGAGLAISLALASEGWRRIIARTTGGARLARGLDGAAVLMGCALVALALSGAQARNVAWAQASAWARAVLDQTAALAPDPADGARFYYANLPTIVNEVYIFTWGLPQAVQIRYGNPTLRASQVSAVAMPNRVRYGLETPLDELERQADAPQVFLVYRPEPETGRLIARVSAEEFAAAVSTGR